MSPKKLDLSNIGGGELMAAVDRELLKICESFADANIKAGAVRTLDIKIKFKPDSKLVTAEIAYNVTAKIPGAQTSTSVAYIAMDKDKNMALFGMDQRQQQMFATEPTVTEIRPVSDMPKYAEPTKPSYATPPPTTNNN